MTNIRTKDLNLLTIFVVIAEELNLSQSSRRLGLSQPALSHALTRLREQFEDPLFVRTQRGLAETPKVRILLPRVRALLAMAGTLYCPTDRLDLAHLKRKVTIAATTYFEALAIGRFVKAAQEQAPFLEIETRALSGGFPKRDLEQGDVDVAIAAYFDELPSGFRIKTVLKEHFVCVCAKKNPYLKTKLTVDDYVRAKHLQIEVPPGVFAPVDQYLQTKKRSRQIALRVGNFLTPGLILDETELLLTCPSSLAAAYADMYGLVVTDLPFRVPAIETKMVWHETNQSDPFHLWLRDSLTQAAQR